MHCHIKVLTLFCLPFAFVSPALASNTIVLKAPTGLTVSVEADSGRYSIAEASPSWIFAGTVTGPLSAVRTSKGSDKIGSFQQVTFSWHDSRRFTADIRLYNALPSVGFSITTVDVLTGPTPDFPAFTSFPSGLHALSYADEVFSPHSFSLQQTSSPWVLFDDTANTVVISPESDYMVSAMHGDGVTELACGLLPTVASVPAGYTHRALLVFGAGVEATMHSWGDELTSTSGKGRPSDENDLMLKYIGYWTDNGAYYYYNYDSSKGYAGTILAIKQEFDSQAIPLHYMQLDSWWYQKTHTYVNGQTGLGWKNSSLPKENWNVYGGTYDYTASPALFPDGLAAFDKQLGIPLVVHARWIDPSSPYHQKYTISGVAAVDPKWWDDRAKYLADNGVACYEQDWLNYIYQYSPQMGEDLLTGAAFTDNMARAAKANGVTLQYCMPTPRYFLQGSNYSNLTTIRTSDDGFRPANWDPFLYTGMLADSLHIRPWTDVFMSADLPNILIADLSTGPVGIGDKIGSESKANIMEAIRTDGVIVKPDVPLLPTDATIVNDANKAHLPLIAATYTDNGVKTGYVFAFTRSGDSSAVSFTPASIGFTGHVYVQPLHGTAKLQDASAAYSDMLGAAVWQYYSIAPVGESGIAFFGDAGKFVGTGRQRIAQISDRPGKLTATVLLLPGEVVTLFGYSSAVPKVSVTLGTADPVQSDSTGKFTVMIHAPISGSSEIPVRSVVTFTTN